MGIYFRCITAHIPYPEISGLNIPQVSSAFKQMCRKTMSKIVYRDLFLNSCPQDSSDYPAYFYENLLDELIETGETAYILFSVVIQWN